MKKHIGIFLGIILLMSIILPHAFAQEEEGSYVDGTVESALELKTSEGTLNDLIIAKTAKIGEKLSFRRYAKVQNLIQKYLEVIFIWG